MFLMEAIYKQIVPCDCFHLLAVMIWLRSHSSAPFATHWQRGSTSLQTETNRRRRSFRRFGARRYEILPRSGSLSYPTGSSYRVHRDEFVRFSTVKMSRTSSFLSVYSSELTKVIVSTLSPNPSWPPAPSAHKTLAAAPATGLDTSPECDPDQPHQLSPLGSALG
jgi:hypothetical protein